MKLMDQMARFGAAWPVPNSSPLPPALDHERIAVRYVLDEEVAAICDNLVRNHFDMLADMLDFARVPVTEFWLERLSNQENSAGGRSRMGCCVSADESGRAGEIVLVTEAPGAMPVVMPQKVVFDFDGTLDCAARAGRFALPVPPDCDANQRRVASVFAMELHRGWEKYYLLDQHNSPLAQQIKAELSASIYDGLFVLAFCVLLSSQRSFREVRVELARLNRHRVSAGRIKLLDHVEVKASLLGRASAAPSGGVGQSGGRGMPRMHVVRGHFVRKGPLLYWRRTHMRGTGGGRIARKTVLVGV